MSIEVDVEFGVATSEPTVADIQRWATAAIKLNNTSALVSVRIVDESEMIELNSSYRKKAKPTNVLSFPAETPKHLELDLMGDIAICAPVVLAEAEDQNKEPKAHWAHMIIHGCLHLAGHDHIEGNDAEAMETIEIKLLSDFGYANPYEFNNDQITNTLAMNN